MNWATHVPQQWKGRRGTRKYVEANSFTIFVHWCWDWGLQLTPHEAGGVMGHSIPIIFQLKVTRVRLTCEKLRFTGTVVITLRDRPNSRPLLEIQKRRTGEATYVPFCNPVCCPLKKTRKNWKDTVPCGKPVAPGGNARDNTKTARCFETRKNKEKLQRYCILRQTKC